jgi:hypothetical protein
MKISLISPLFLILLLFATLACKDDEPVNPAPVFTITSPTDAQIQAGFVRGETVQITGTVTDNVLVDNIVTEIHYNGINTGQGETIQIGEQTANINYSITIPVDAPTGEYRMVLIATDNEGATSRWDKSFQVR